MVANFLKDTVLKPLFKRLGTVGAAALVFGGDWLCANVNACGLVTSDGANQVMAYVIAVALLLVDLTSEYLSRRKRGA